MSWSRRTVLLAVLGTAGCGFAPVYGPGGGAEGLRGEIAVDPPVDQAGYILVKRLEERLGLPQTPRYRLSATLALGQDDLGVTPDQEIQRYQVTGRARWSLVDTGTDTVVVSGTQEAFTGYSAPVVDNHRGSIAGNTVSVLSAERDARRRLMVILADQIVARLLATSADWRR
jgi:LPS-assembly lipoprotein